MIPLRRHDQERAAPFVFVSPRGGFGLYLKRPTTFQDNTEPLKMEDIAEVIQQLCEQLMVPGLVHRERDPREEGDVPGYQLNAAAMVWRAGTGFAAQERIQSDRLDFAICRYSDWRWGNLYPDKEMGENRQIFSGKRGGRTR